MKSFSYVITDPQGVHARPAGELVKAAKKYESKITVTKEGKSADAAKLLALMSLGIKKDQRIEVTIEGADEEAACAELEEFLKQNL